MRSHSCQQMKQSHFAVVNVLSKDSKMRVESENIKCVMTNKMRENFLSRMKMEKLNYVRISFISNIA